MRIFKKSSLKKYFRVFQISFEQEFAYRFNFIMWRVRNVLQIFLVFFLWDTVFSDPNKVLFGYTREKILTYVFLTMFVKALVFSARAVDVAGEIAQGELSNYLLKPVSYFKYWMTRDLSSKALNISFALVEFSVLAILLRPHLYIQLNPFYILAALVSVGIAVFIYFSLLFIVSAVPFWMPEAAWGGQFLLITFLDFLSGSLFPIDILPSVWQKVLYLTPFPYLIFFPLQTYLGNFDFKTTILGLFVSAFWAFILWNLMKNVWKRGMFVYQAFGR